MLRPIVISVHMLIFDVARKFPLFDSTGEGSVLRSGHSFVQLPLPSVSVPERAAVKINLKHQPYSSSSTPVIEKRESLIQTLLDVGH